MKDLRNGLLQSSPNAKKTKKRRISTPFMFIVGLLVVLLMCTFEKLSLYYEFWMYGARVYEDYGDENVLDVYPVESAKMRLADIPPPRTGQRKEPSLREAFPLLKWPEPVPVGSTEAIREDISKQIETIHLHNTTQKEVDYYVTRGYVVVVDDMAKGHPMLGWSCETFAEKWPNGLIRGEYPAPWRLNDPEEGFTLRLRRTDIWIHTFRPAWIQKFYLPGCLWNKKCNNYIDNAAPAAAYVWHVKDREPQELKESVQRLFKVPYFVNSKFVADGIMDSFEMWFAPVKGGTYAHADRYCITTVSMQLKGSKEWRIMNPGPRVDTYKDRFLNQDSEIYAEKRPDQEEWTPELVVTVPEGGGIIFPPYSYHETVTNNAECSAATTFNYDATAATRYLRHYLPRLLNQHLGYKEACHRFWDDWALWTMVEGIGVPDSSGNIMPPPTEEYYMRDTNEFGATKLYSLLPTTDEHLMQVRFKKIMKDVDTNGDDVLDKEEIIAYGKTRHKEFDTPRFDSYYEEYLGYYDLDDDGIITKDEVWSGWEHWNINSAYAILTHMGGPWDPSVPDYFW